MNRILSLLFVAFGLASLEASPQDLPYHPKPAAKVCVATISNMSARAVLEERLTERLSKDLGTTKFLP
jgi:hypothetical protein